MKIHYFLYVWSAYYYDVFDKVYLPRGESFDLLLSLFENNFGDNTPYEWKHIIQLVNGDIGKENTYYIRSPPNAGKSTFYDLLADFFICSGQLRHWNRSNSFPIEELNTARIAFWNEPSFEPSVTDELLKLLGGDRISINIKYRAPRQISHIPLFVSSNEYKFPNSA